MVCPNCHGDIVEEKIGENTFYKCLSDRGYYWLNENNKLEALRDPVCHGDLVPQENGKFYSKHIREFFEYDKKRKKFIPLYIEMPIIPDEPAEQKFLSGYYVGEITGKKYPQYEKAHIEGDYLVGNETGKKLFIDEQGRLFLTEKENRKYYQTLLNTRIIPFVENGKQPDGTILCESSYWTIEEQKEIDEKRKRILEQREQQLKLQILKMENEKKAAIKKMEEDAERKRLEITYPGMDITNAQYMEYVGTNLDKIDIIDAQYFFYMTRRNKQFDPKILKLRLEEMQKQGYKAKDNLRAQEYLKSILFQDIINEMNRNSTNEQNIKPKI